MIRNSPALWNALFLGLLACTAGTTSDGLKHQFATRPVYLQVSSELPAECNESLLDAVAFYRHYDVTMVLTPVDPGAKSQLGIPVAGVVAIEPGMLSDGVEGQTSLALTIGGDIYGAEITLASCKPRVVSHEIGHALGLEHDDDAKGNLMYPIDEGGGWDLTAEQIRWIGDPGSLTLPIE